jgi:hypothetical protein
VSDEEKLETPSDERLLEIASNMKVQSYELGPLDREDIRAATLELHSLRQKQPKVRRPADLVDAAT